MRIQEWLLGLVCVLGFGSLVWADDSADLGRVVVSSYRSDDVLGRTPAALTVITSGDIQRMNAQSVTDVLKELPGITARDWYGNGAKAVVDMAGFGEQGALNVLVLLDGRRVNNVDISGVDWDRIPLERVERIEVMRGGSGGVLYGDNASSGVINIITKRGADQPSVELKTGWGSYAYETQNISVSGGKENKYSYWFNGGRSVTNGYRMNSFSRALDLGSSLGYDLTDTFSVKVSSGLHSGSYGLPGALWQNHIDQYGRRYARYGDDMTKNNDYFIVVGLENHYVDLGTSLMDFSYHRKEAASFFRTSGNPTLRDRIETFGLTPRHIFNFDVAGRDNKLTAGVDLYRSFYRSSQYDYTDEDVLQNYTHVTKTSLAGYLQDELKLFDPLALVAGARYETARYAFNYHDNDTTSWGHPYPGQDQKAQPLMRAFNTGLVYDYSEGSNVYAGVAKSFRFPGVDEFTYQNAAFQQQLDTSLRPQTALTYEMGVRHKFAESINSSASLFRMNVQDELYFNSNGGPWGFGKNENYDQTVHQGAATSLDIKLTEHLSVAGEYTFTEAYFDGGTYNKNSIPLVARHKAGLGLRMALSKGLTMNLMDHYIGKRYALNDQANAQGRVNGYMVLDSNLLWKVKAVTFSLGVNNVLDKQYAEMSGYAFNTSTASSDRFYYPSPGRNYNASVEYKF